MTRTRCPRPATLVFFAALAVTLIIGMQQSNANYVFEPPPGWYRVLAIGSGLGIWVHPGDQNFSQNINVFTQRYDGPLSNYAAVGIAAIRSRYPSIGIGAVQQARTTVCGTHPSMYFTYAAIVNGTPLIYEQMATIWQGVAFIATYTRRSDQPSLPEARRSLITLCGGLPPGRYLPSGYPAPRARYTGRTRATYAPPATVGSVAPTVTPRIQPW